MLAVQNCVIPLWAFGSAACWWITHIWWLFGERLSVAGHRFTFALIDVGQYALLMHGSQLMLLGVAFLLECLNRSLKLHSHIKTYSTSREKESIREKNERIAILL